MDCRVPHHLSTQTSRFRKAAWILENPCQVSRFLTFAQSNPGTQECPWHPDGSIPSEALLPPNTLCQHLPRIWQPPTPDPTHAPEVPPGPVAEQPYLLWHTPNIDLGGIRASLSVKAQFSKGNAPESIPHQAGTASQLSAQGNKGRITGSWQNRGVTTSGDSRSCGLPVFFYFLEREYGRWSL